MIVSKKESAKEFILRNNNKLQQNTFRILQGIEGISIKKLFIQLFVCILAMFFFSKIELPGVDLQKKILLG